MKRLFFISVMLVSFPAWPLGLGELVFHSYLNQAANADIDLLTAKDEDIPALKIQIASPDVFRQVGVTYIHSLQDLRFIVKTNQDRSYIQVTSHEPVREPVLDFILDVSWPGGHLRRNYSVIINPPPVQ